MTTFFLTPSWWGPLSYKNQLIGLLSKSVDWFLYDRDLRHRRVKVIIKSQINFHSNEIFDQAF